MTSLRSSRPPVWGSEAGTWALDSPKQLRDLRASLHHALTGQTTLSGHLDDIPEKMVLVATELATNALRHGRPPTEVRLYRGDDHFIIDVADRDPRILPEYAAARPPGAGGLGLQLARQFSLDIGWFVADDAKHVWAQFPA
jgi:serine/threonine-protein kinase RsbW